MKTKVPLIHDGLREAFIEITNIGLGKAAAALSDMTGRSVLISVPSLEVFDSATLASAKEIEPITSVRINQAFSGKDISGQAMLVLNRSGALRLAVLLMGEPREHDVFGNIEQMALLETGNIMIGSVMGILGNMLQSRLQYDLPSLQIKADGAIGLLSDIIRPDNSWVILVKATLTIGEEDVSGYFIILFQENSIVTLSSLIEKQLAVK